MKFIQIAGTNGKGSVATLTASIITKAGYGCGLFTSPHLIEKEERIRVNGACIPKAEFDALLQKYADAPSPFAAYTRACVDWFERKNVEIAVMETGLGGRLDPVTELGAGLVAITRIGLDHTELLGDTLALIAAEKCAIIREGATVVSCNQQPEAAAVLERVCREKRARLIYANGATARETAARMAAALARALGISEDVIAGALAETLVPARLQYFPSLDMLIDGGHNADALGELSRTIARLYADRKRVWLVAMMRDKDISALEALLAGETDIFTTSVGGARPFTPEELAEKLGGQPLPMPAALNAALARARESGALLIVAGSFYLAGEVLRETGVSL